MQSNRKLLGMLLIGLFFGTGLGYLLGTATGASHDHGTHDHGDLR